MVQLDVDVEEEQVADREEQEEMHSQRHRDKDHPWDSDNLRALVRDEEGQDPDADVKQGVET